MGFWRALGGVTQYEFTMQLRRPSLWIVFAIVAVLLQAVLTNFTDPGTGIVPTAEDTLLLWTTTCNFLLAVGAGLLIADRTPRDAKVKALELLRASPASTLGRISGKYAGSVLATLVPIALVYLIGVVRILIQFGDIATLPLAAAAFATMLVPAVFFVGAFSIACTTVLWAPLYQFLFVGYWLWNSLNPGQSIPTLGGTLLSPTLSYVINGFFHLADYYPVDKAFYPDSSVALGIANIAVLLACAALALFAAWRIERWRMTQ